MLVPRLTISADGKFLLVGSTLNWGGGRFLGSVALWRVDNAKLVKEFRAADGWFTPMCFAADGKGLVMMRVYEKEKGLFDSYVAYCDLSVAKETKKIDPLLLTVRELRDLPGGKLAAVLDDGCVATLGFWDWETGKETKRIVLGKPRMKRGFCIQLTADIWSPDGRFALTATGRNGTAEDKLEVQIWDARTGDRLNQWTDDTRK